MHRAVAFDSVKRVAGWQASVGRATSGWAGEMAGLLELRVDGSGCFSESIEGACYAEYPYCAMPSSWIWTALRSGDVREGNS